MVFNIVFSKRKIIVEILYLEVNYKFFKRYPSEKIEDCKYLLDV